MIKLWFRKKTHLCKPYIWWNRMLRKDQEEKEKDDVSFLSFCNNYINNAATRLYYAYAKEQDLLREAIYEEDNVLVIITFNKASRYATILSKKGEKITDIAKPLSAKFTNIIKNNFDSAFLKNRTIEMQRRKAITNEVLQQLKWEIGVE